MMLSISPIMFRMSEGTGTELFLCEFQNDYVLETIDYHAAFICSLIEKVVTQKCT